MKFEGLGVIQNIDRTPTRYGFDAIRTTVTLVVEVPANTPVPDWVVRSNLRVTFEPSEGHFEKENKRLQSELDTLKRALAKLAGI